MTNNRMILVVEDDVGLSEMLIAYFQAQGYLVEAPASGEAALECVAQTTPNLGIRIKDSLVHDGMPNLTVTRLTSTAVTIASFGDLRLALQSNP